MIKASDLLKAVIRLGQERPDEMARCRYFNQDGAPCCIVGHGLAELGVDAVDFLDDDTLNRWTPVWGLVDAGIVNDDERFAVNQLYDIQAQQDKRRTWGYAVHRAALNTPSQQPNIPTGWSNQDE